MFHSHGRCQQRTCAFSVACGRGHPKAGGCRRIAIYQAESGSSLWGQPTVVGIHHWGLKLVNCMFLRGTLSLCDGSLCALAMLVRLRNGIPQPLSTLRILCIFLLLLLLLAIALLLLLLCLFFTFHILVFRILLLFILLLLSRQGLRTLPLLMAILLVATILLFHACSRRWLCVFLSGARMAETA